MDEAFIDEAIMNVAIMMWLVVGSVGGRRRRVGRAFGGRADVTALHIGKVLGRIFEIGAHALVCMEGIVAALQEAFHRLPDVGTKSATRHHAARRPRRRKGRGKRKRRGRGEEEEKEEERKADRAAKTRGRGWCTKHESSCNDARWIAMRRCCGLGNQAYSMHSK
jgi:hypothetical protein